ncbi:MAG: PilZ domain-containing protein [Oligoflexia bacterium]|nr:PilZ domain-containing protein [Oligoflexia bacterium]
MQSDELEGHISSENAAGEIIEASVLLNDLSLHGIGIYAPSLIQAGNHLTINLTIELSEKRTLTLQGKVMWCQRSENHRVISQSNFPYRVGIRFQFASTAEEEEYAAFWNQLQKEHLYLQKPEK